MLLFYGNGGLAEMPTSEESNVLQASLLKSAYTLAGDSTATNATLANVADTSLVLAGDKIYGPGWNGGATVLSKTANSVTMTAPADTTVAAGDYAAVRNGSLSGCICVAVAAVPGVQAKNLTFADLTLATFDGYADSGAVVFSTPLNGLNGNVLMTGDKKQFRCTGSTTANTIYGMALVDAAKTTVYQYDPLLNQDGTPAPVMIEGPGDGFDYVPMVSLS